MADDTLITTYIDAIEHAVYGREVRSAIANGIKKCYTDVSGGVTLAEDAASDAQEAVSTAQNAASAAQNAVANAETALSTAQNASTDAQNAVNRVDTALSDLNQWFTDSVANVVETLAYLKIPYVS